MNLTLGSITFVKTTAAFAPLQMKIRVPVVPTAGSPDNFQRKDVETPEWPPRAKNAHRSPVLFPLCFAGGETLDVRACIHSAEPGDFQIRARAGSPRNIMGSLNRTQVHFPAAGCADCNPALSAPLLSDWLCHRVDSHRDVWIWEAAPVGSQNFQTIARTTHQVFTTLGAPQPPWDLGGDRKPWFEVVRLACFLARGSRSADEAATRITKAIYGLGERRSRRLHYTRGKAHYVVDTIFDMEGFLEFLFHGERCRSSRVECHDIASLVTTLVNVLGGHLYEAKIGNNFRTGPIRLIGTGVFDSLEFAEHEVAWGGAAGIGDPVWDGCLAFPSLGGSTAAPVSPVALTFSDNTYRGRLIGASKAGPKGPVAAGRNREFGRVVDQLSEETGPTPSEFAPPDQTEHVFAFRFAPSEVADLNIIAWRKQILGPGLTAFSCVWDSSDHASDHRLEIRTVPARSESAALDYLNRVKSHFSITPQRLSPFPELAFGSYDGEFIIMVVGNLFLDISNIGVDIRDVRPLAIRLAETLRTAAFPSQPQPLSPTGVKVDEVFASLQSTPDGIDSVFLRSASRLLLDDDVLRSASPQLMAPAAVSVPNALENAQPIL